MEAVPENFTAFRLTRWRSTPARRSLDLLIWTVETGVGYVHRFIRYTGIPTPKDPASYQTHSLSTIPLQ